jgi:hypothetical protein
LAGGNRDAVRIADDHHGRPIHDAYLDILKRNELFRNWRRIR